MIEIGNEIVSFDVIEECFLCDIASCKGICCVEGDSGAPLTTEEVSYLEKILPIIWGDLSDKSKKIIEQQGVAYEDEEGEMVTSIVDDKECVFTYEEEGIWKCAIEKAYREGKIDFKKPISCHLYPIRLQKFNRFTAVSYHKWDVCKEACYCGKKAKLPVYKFLKEPLIRRFGEEWYAELEEIAEQLKHSDLGRR